MGNPQLLNFEDNLKIAEGMGIENSDGLEFFPLMFVLSAHVRLHATQI